MGTISTKFALHSFKGTPTRFFRCEAEDLASQAPVVVKKPSHHVLVLDRSGSMYGDIDEVKSTVEKLLTLSEFRDPTLKISLISYSSQGDVKLHFAKVTVEDVMRSGSPYIGEIRSIRATALTCISQGLVMAETLVDDADVTCVTLHTDGFANDTSPTAEAKAIKAAVANLKKHPNLFANTIGYRDWCDYNLLASISNGLSGVCIQAKGISQVYASIYDTTKLLAGTMSPAIEVGRGKSDYVMFVSRSAGKVLGMADTFSVQGLSPTDDKTAYRLYEVSAKDYSTLNVPVSGEDAPVTPVLAYARTQIAEGNLNAAKYALVSTRSADLLNAHSRSLVSSDVAAFAAGVEGYLFKGTSYTPTTGYGLGQTGPSVLEVLTYLNAHTSTLSVDLAAFTKSYKRRGIKRIPGTRLADGTVEEPTVVSRYRDGDGWAKVNSFDLNRNTATINMLVSQPIDLFKKGENTRVASVAGVSLDDLKSFNNYTVVGDGMLNAPTLTLRTADAKTLDGLIAMGAPIFTCTPGQPFNLHLSSLPLVDYDLNVGAVDFDTVRSLARLTVLSKILNGMVKGDSSGLTSDQVEELKKHYLTPAMYFSPPSTTEYADLNEAIATGKVDTKLSYKVDLGTPDITAASKLKSGNEYLQRRFTLTFLGKDVEKPTLDYLIMPGAVWGVKKLSARTVLDAVDEISYPIYEGVLGLGEGKEAKALLKSVGCTDPDRFLNGLRGENAKESVKVACHFVEKAIESIYEKIRPLAFYVGATGLVPDTLGAKSFTSEEFSTAHPEAKLSKAEKEEGNFFVLPDQTVLTVFVKAEHFST